MVAVSAAWFAVLPIGAAIVIVADHLRRSFEREARAMIVRTSAQERAIDAHVTSSGANR